MKRFTLFTALALGLAACGDTSPTIGTRTSEQAPVARSYDLQDITFVAPADLRVSEANRYYPIGDVVWRGDPLGDRIAQINAIFEAAAARADRGLTGATPVIADITLVRFHGVTEKTRFSVGGVYNIVFMLTVRDARTGTVLEAPRKVVANLPAPGGNRAIELVAQGQTEKVRVTDYLTTVLLQELSGV